MATDTARVPRFPEVKWAQRKDAIFITVELSDAKNLKIDLQEKSLDFHAETDTDVYEFNMEFPEKIDTEKSKYSTDRVVRILLQKQEAQRWSALSTSAKKLHWLKCDWDKWLDTEEEEEMANKSFNDFDFSKFGGMGDALGGGLGGFGGGFDEGMGDGLGQCDSDEEDDEGLDQEYMDKLEEPLNLEDTADAEATPEGHAAEVADDSKAVGATDATGSVAAQCPPTVVA